MRLLLDVSAVPDRPVGAGYYTLNLAAHLAERDDIELHLLCRQRDSTRWEQLAPRARVLAEVPAGRPARLVWEQARAAALARGLCIDVWHGPHYTMPLRVAVPTVVTVHDLTFFEHPEWHERGKVAFFRPMIRAAVHRAAVVVAVSDDTRERLRRVALPTGPIVVAPHGVDHERFNDAVRPTDDAVLATHGIRAPYIAFTGTIEPRKGLPNLVEAFAGVAREHPKLRLVIAGADGWGSDQVRAAIAASGVSTRVFRPGYLPDDAIAPFFRRAAVVAYPSLAEGFGLNALEALACGAPLVTTTGSALDEVVGDAALAVTPGDVDSLAGALRDALCPETAARLRTAGPARAAGFTWERSIERHMEAYRLAQASAFVTQAGA
ncbi:MAG TPA: glycosyltransferase family 1 protein [Acidimicrobiia bacterium]|nr:glycosyltransferase family 1 protein [Acidimicrobiia bacterium]